MVLVKMALKRRPPPPLGGMGVQKGREEGSDLPPPLWEDPSPARGVTRRILGGRTHFWSPQAGGFAGGECWGGAGSAASSAIPIPRMTPSFCQFLPAFPLHPPPAMAGSRRGPPFSRGGLGGLIPEERSCREGAASHPSPGGESDFPVLHLKKINYNNDNNNNTGAGALSCSIDLFYRPVELFFFLGGEGG